MSEQGSLFEGFSPTAPTKEARPYQVESVALTEQSLKVNKSALVVMATGTGKTFCAGLLASRARRRVLFMAHRDELLGQSVAALEEITGERVGLEQASFFSHGERIVVASVQTLHKDKRLQRFDPAEFDYLIVDEAHRSMAVTYQKVIDYFVGGGCKVVGYTATPGRSDGRALGKTYEDVPFTLDITDGIRGGWLVRVKAEIVVVDELQLEEVATSGGDFQVGALDREVRKACAFAVDKVLDEYSDKTAMWFFPGLLSAEFAHQRIEERLPGESIFIHGKTDKDERRYQTSAFKKGRFSHYVNVGVATEGFDAPNVDLIAIVRPTKSATLLGQIIGRGTRPLPGTIDHIQARGLEAERRQAIADSKKPSMLILDFTGSLKPGVLARPADILGGSYDDEVVEKANRMAEQQPGEDILDLLEAAKAQQEELKRQLTEAARKTKVKAKSHTVSVDPFSVAGVSDAERDRDKALDLRYGARPMTAKQKSALENILPKDQHGVLEGMSFRAASRMLDGLLSRKDNGLASPKQIAQIRRYLPVPDDLGRLESDNAMAYIKKTVWSRRGAFNIKTLRKLVGLDEREPGDDLGEELR